MPRARAGAVRCAGRFLLATRFRGVSSADADREAATTGTGMGTAGTAAAALTAGTVAGSGSVGATYVRRASAATPMAMTTRSRARDGSEAFTDSSAV
jgi:hypothetical protein